MLTLYHLHDLFNLYRYDAISVSLNRCDKFPTVMNSHEIHDLIGHDFLV